MIKDMKTPQVVLILGLTGMVLAAVVVLTVFGKDSAGVYAFGGAILIGLGVMAGTTAQLSTNTNGNTTRMLEMLDTQAKTTAALLSLMTPSSAKAEDKVIELSSPIVTTVAVQQVNDDTVVMPAMRSVQ